MSAETPDSESTGNDDERTPEGVRRMGATYAFGRMVVTPLGRLLYRPRVEGRHHVPRQGPVIFASNHLSFIDSIAIPVAAPRPVRATSGGFRLSAA